MTRPEVKARVVLPPAAAGGVDLAAWRAAIKALPVDALDKLHDQFTPSARSARRVRDREDALARIALGHVGSWRAVAEAIHTELTRYQATTWRFERDLSDSHLSRNPRAHCYLRATRGDVPAARTLRLELANLGRNNLNSAQGFAHSAGN